MRVVGYHVSSNGIAANSDGEVINKPPYLEFLLQSKPDSIKMFYYLAQNIPSLAKIIKMSEREVKILHGSSQKKCYLPPYKIQYIPNRYLLIQKGFYRNNPYTYFYDAHQYGNTQTTALETEESCVTKAKEAQAIGEQVKNSLSEIGLHPKGLTSPINLFQKEVMDKYDLPKDEDVPKMAGYFAYECCKGNWLEAFQVGHWERSWDYDLSSAYPSRMINLLDIRQGKWIESNQVQEKASYGYCKGRVTITENFSPILYKNSVKSDSLDNISFMHTPTGTWDTFLTKKEIEFINRWKLGKFEITEGWWWIADKDAKKPLESIINWLYMEKENTEGIKREIIKRIMAGIYGKMLENRNGEIGETFNSVWAAEVETNTRLKVADFVLRNNAIKNLIHIAVDGAIFAEPLTIGDNRIGKWRLSNISPCICIGAGQVALRDKGKGDFHLGYDWLKEEIEKDGDKDEYVMKSVKPVTLGEVINNQWDKLGELQEVKKYVSIGRRDNRCYKEKPKNGRELMERSYESLPLDISIIKRGD